MSSTDDPPFTRIAIIGLGLIGGSIALALRERWPSCRVLGMDRPAVIAHALGSGAIDRATADFGEIASGDLVILAAPVAQNIQLLAGLSDHVRTWRPSGDGVVRRPLIVTDVGGTKRDIVAAGRAVAPMMTFVGGHPIGGAERGGFGFARPDLFAGRPWILTPDESTSADAVRSVSAFAQGLRARPTMMGAAEHDRVMAFISHLPQLTASALMGVAGAGAGAEGLRVAGRGLMDTTRLASSTPEIWREICAANQDEIGRALDQLIATLSDLRQDLTQGAAVDAIFAQAARWRAELMKERE